MHRQAEQSALTLGVFLLVTASAAPARANGAFPGSLRVFAPPGRPDYILLATNFGLISTDDGGARWEWTCEHDAGSLAGAYEIGTGPEPLLYAGGPAGFAVSRDDACSWTSAAGLQSAAVSGLFSEPGAPERVWVIAYLRDAGAGAGPGAFFSTDGGASFGPPRYRAAAGATIDSLESARSRPQRVYLTVSHGGPARSVALARSDDGGATFTTFDLTGRTGGDQLRIAAVDPVEPDRLYLRLQSFPDEKLLISADGGQTLTDALVVERGRLSGFVRRADGSLVAGAVSDSRGGSVHVAAAAGAPFELRSTAIRPSALAERAGLLLAVTDNFADGFALARSADGAAWEPLLRYTDVSATRLCPLSLARACAASCSQQVANGIFRDEVCAASIRPLLRPDAAASPAAPARSGCACRPAAQASDDGAGSTFALLLLLLAAARRSRAPRPPRGGDRWGDVAGAADEV